MVIYVPHLPRHLSAVGLGWIRQQPASDSSDRRHSNSFWKVVVVMADKPRNCPFCGTVPYLRQHPGRLDAYGCRIECITVGCRVLPYTAWTETIDEAIRIWNRESISAVVSADAVKIDSAVVDAFSEYIAERSKGVDRDIMSLPDESSVMTAKEVSEKMISVVDGNILLNCVGGGSMMLRYFPPTDFTSGCCSDQQRHKFARDTARAIQESIAPWLGYPVKE